MSVTADQPAGRLTAGSVIEHVDIPAQRRLRGNSVLLVRTNKRRQIMRHYIPTILIMIGFGVFAAGAQVNETKERAGGQSDRSGD